MSQKILIIGGTSLVGSTFLQYAPKNSELFVTEHEVSFTESNITSKKIEVISIAPMMSEAIKRISNSTSVSSLFK